MRPRSTALYLYCHGQGLSRCLNAVPVPEAWKCFYSRWWTRRPASLQPLARGAGWSRDCTVPVFESEVPHTSGWTSLSSAARRSRTLWSDSIPVRCKFACFSFTTESTVSWRYHSGFMAPVTFKQETCYCVHTMKVARMILLASPGLSVQNRWTVCIKFVVWEFH
jgi:hypothetical protein